MAPPVGQTLGGGVAAAASAELALPSVKAKPTNVAAAILRSDMILSPFYILNWESAGTMRICFGVMRPIVPDPCRP